jgi:metal-responsive CopG/Arc/MetJ family transcriptional regulator
MRQKISICVDEKLLESLDHEVAKGLFRNRSQLIEFVMKSQLAKQSAIPQPEVSDDAD